MASLSQWIEEGFKVVIKFCVEPGFEPCLMKVGAELLTMVVGVYCSSSSRSVVVGIN